MTTISHSQNPYIDKAKHGQTVLVLQGGGALGAYQGGVYQALDEAGVEPDWVIGTSIGAINAGIIAGNAPENRLQRLQEFWSRMEHSSVTRLFGQIPVWGTMFTNAITMMSGINGFFTPNHNAGQMAAESAGLYTTAPLAATLTDLIDLDILNSRALRLTVGAANVRTAEMHYFDSNHQPLSIQHIMASGALPPAFPAVRIDGELYWDGGIISNTPVEAVFDDHPRQNSVVFSVHVWSPNGPEPDSIVRVLSRQKDLQYASRSKSHITRQKQIHKMRHVVSELIKRLPEEVRNSPDAQELAGFACTTKMHVVRLVAPPIAGEDHTKDIDFSREGIRNRWEAGYADTCRVLEQKPWLVDVDPLEGFILHETEAGHVVSHS